MNDLQKNFSDHIEKFEIKNNKNLEKLIDKTSLAATENCKQLITNMVLLACDIGSSTRHFLMSFNWTNFLYEEFFRQGDIEYSKNLNVSA